MRKIRIEATTAADLAAVRQTYVEWSLTLEE
jgi:hypothetical protein